MRYIKFILCEVWFFVSPLSMLKATATAEDLEKMGINTNKYY